MTVWAGLRIAAMAGLMASPALATLEADPADGYRGICQMTHTCTADNFCGATPVLGDLLVVIGADRTWMGRDDADLAPVDRYPTLDAALPLPQLGTRRRTFLTDLPPEGTARRFAVRIQTLRPETGEPVLRGQHFILTCHEAPA